MGDAANNDLLSARLLQRLNRFTALVEVEGTQGLAHIPNSGRMRELLFPGAAVMLKPASRQDRKTGYDLIFAFYEGIPVCIDSQLPNRLLAEEVSKGKIPELAGYALVQKEVQWGNSRFDLMLQGSSRPPCLVEVKSVNLVQQKTALFPDAPTERGRRHVEELVRALSHGLQAAVYFIVMREDAGLFKPHDLMDPAFGQALREAAASGVEVYARSCRIKDYRVSLGNILPVDLTR